jgi:hypothetical protein
MELSSSKKKQIKSKLDTLNDDTLNYAHKEFLRAIKAYAPDVLSSLAKKIMPLYSALSHSDLESIHYPPLCSENPLSGAALQFKLVLGEWAKGYHLTDDWLIREALHTLEKWRLSDVADDWAYAQMPKRGYKAGHGFNFTFEPWNGRVETKRSYKARAKAAFDLLLNDHLQRPVERNTKTVKNAFDNRELSHFNWLVQFQVKSMSYEEIFEHHFPKEHENAKLRGDMSERTKRIRKAINQLAQLIQLSLRKDGTAPGRPAKTR